MARERVEEERRRYLRDRCEDEGDYEDYPLMDPCTDPRTTMPDAAVSLPGRVGGPARFRTRSCPPSSRASAPLPAAQGPSAHTCIRPFYRSSNDLRLAV